MNSGEVQIPVTVYPGVFPQELQVTFLVASGKEVSANVPSDHVKLDEELSERGAKGYLTVNVVGKVEGDKVIISVPGEVLGSPSRVRMSPKELQQIA